MAGSSRTSDRALTFEAADAFQVGAVERLGQPEAAAPAARPAHDGAAFDPAREYEVEFLADLEMAVMDEAGAVLRQIDEFDRRRRAFVGHRLGLRDRKSTRLNSSH